MYDEFQAMRRAMVDSQLRTNAVDDPRVIAAMGTVRREDFVPPAQRATAYADLPVPLDGDRALNPPMVTGRLINAANIRPGERVLVVGAASGYAVAVIAALDAEVTGVESDAALAERARATLADATVVIGPLDQGYPAHGPYDAIVIDGAVEQLPSVLIDQLTPAGRLTTAIVERGVTRLAAGRRGGTGFGLIPFADADAVLLPGFARKPAFVF